MPEEIHGHRFMTQESVSAVLEQAPLREKLSAA